MTDAAAQTTPDLIDLKNHDSTRMKWVYDEEDGKRYELPPLGRDRFKPEIARLFLEQFPNYVRPYEEPRLPERPKEKTVYIANISGMRTLPGEVLVTRNINGEDREVEVQNPLCTPQTVEHTIQGNQIISGPDDNRKSRKEMSFKVTLEPLKRVAVPWGVAETILGRDLRAPKMLQGRVRRVPGPAAVEPNESWPLDEIRAFAFLTDPKYFSKKRLNATYPPEKSFTPAGKKEPDENAIRRTKMELLDALFPCLIDEGFPKPQSREAFDALKVDALRELDAGK